MNTFQCCWQNVGAMGPVLVLLGVLSLLVGLAGCTAVSLGGIGKPAPDGPRLSFQEREHDFGSISASKETEYRFALANTGNRSLEIGELRLEPANPPG